MTGRMGMMEKEGKRKLSFMSSFQEGEQANIEDGRGRGRLNDLVFCCSVKRNKLKTP